MSEEPQRLILLKKCASPVEANLIKAKLATAGIPAVLTGDNTFARDVMLPMPNREVDVFVPASLVDEARAVLEAPADEPDELAGEPIVDDPARVSSARAFAAGVAGWCLFVLAVYGVFLALPTFAYSIYLAVRSLIHSAERSPSLLFKCVSALAISIAGLIFAVALLVYLSRD